MVPLLFATPGRWKRGSRPQTRRSFGGGADLHLRQRPRRPRGAVPQCERRAPVAMGGPLSLGPPPLPSSRLPYALTHTGCVHSFPRGSFKCFSSNSPPPRHASALPLLLPEFNQPPSVPALPCAAAPGQAGRAGNDRRGSPPLPPRQPGGRNASASAQHPRWG